VTPQRIQLRRAKGWRKPEGAITVSRPSKWGNGVTLDDVSAYVDFGPILHPVALSESTKRAIAVDAYREWLAEDMAVFPDEYASDLAALRGHDLACWCPLDQPCHADVLLELANA
jgi:hypothetical protein